VEDRFRHVRAAATLAELEGAKAVDRQRAESAWRRKLATLGEDIIILSSKLT
jgi:hypothetical protein